MRNTNLLAIFATLFLPVFADAQESSRLKTLPGFEADLVYEVPRDSQGSWVALTVDPQGRFIVSDQYGSLYRFPLPEVGQKLAPGQLERIDLDIGEAQGLLHAFDSLYIVVNSFKRQKGLYRVRDTDGDDRYDEVKLLRAFRERAGEHGPHAILLSPDGQSLTIVAGNQIELTSHVRTRVAPVWGEDQILPRVYGKGFMKGTLAPRGWIAKTDPNGENWEIIATGFRNPYDAAFNREGELFTYDADMEWDMNTPWYRPTRINHVISGADFGWRNGSAKWPAYYPDSFGAAVDIGPGSPTGVSFGYGAKFPERYQNALYAADWSYGILYAVHLEPDGASYTGSFEKFLSGRPLPLTDLVVHPADGHLYFTTGGRRVQSALYRVRYTGEEPVSAAAQRSDPTGGARALRHRLEDFHGRSAVQAVDEAWRYLGSDDRAIRHAARVALEHQPVEWWLGLAVAETDPRARLAALLAAVRVGEGHPHLLDVVLESARTLNYEALPNDLRLELLRVYGLAVIRHGGGFPNTLTANQSGMILGHLEAQFPAASVPENIELSQILANLGAESLPAKAVELLETTPSQDAQIALAKNIRLTKAGWTPELRRRYFEWFVRAQTYRGGASFGLFVESIKNDAIASLPAGQRDALASLIDAKPQATTPAFTTEPREFVKNWTASDFDDVIHVGLEGGRRFENGRKLFGVTGCYACHRFNGQGGAIGPDLTSAAGKFSPPDLLESILDPSKEISDQYGATVYTMKDGSVVIGRVVNLREDDLQINTNMFDPNAITSIKRDQIVSAEESPVSMMPPGLLNTLDKDDVLDLLAYILSRGNAEDPYFAN